MVSPAPAEGLTLLGWDVLEPIEPFWSPLAAEELHAAGLNAHGLFDTRAAAESFAAAGTWDVDEPLVAARIWLCPSAG